MPQLTVSVTLWCYYSTLLFGARCEHCTEYVFFGSLIQDLTFRVIYIHSLLVVADSGANVGATVRLVVSLDVVDTWARRRLKARKLAMFLSTGYSRSAETGNYSARLLVIVALWQAIDRVDHRILSDLGLQTGRYQRVVRG